MPAVESGFIITVWPLDQSIQVVAHSAWWCRAATAYYRTSSVYCASSSIDQLAPIMRCGLPFAITGSRRWVLDPYAALHAQLEPL